MFNFFSKEYYKYHVYKFYKGNKSNRLPLPVFKRSYRIKHILQRTTCSRSLASHRLLCALSSLGTTLEFTVNSKRVGTWPKRGTTCTANTCIAMP